MIRTAQFLVLAACCLSAACSNEQLAQRMVAAPNGAGQVFRAEAPKQGPALSASGGSAYHFRCEDPDATLALWVHAPAQKPRGTILLLHGILNDHHQLDSVSGSLVAAGYRTVQVDLRGHGESTGKHISFGVFDARDLSALVTALQKQNLCDETVGIYGVSYGGAAGLLMAGADPRVKAMVTVASFATLRDEAPHFARQLLPLPGAMLSDADFTAILKQAGEIAGFEPNDASPVDAIAKTHAQILLIHGDQDLITPVEASRELNAAASDHCELDVMTGKGHLDLAFDLFGALHGRTLAWFDRYLANDAAAPRAAIKAP